MRLGSIASVHRGISTGANHFFVLEDKKARDIGISEEDGYLKKVIPTRIPKIKFKSIFDYEDWSILKEEGKPCWLLYLPRIPEEDLPAHVRKYLRKGERLGVHLTPTSRSRKYWHHVRIPASGRHPDLFFTYISRGFPVFAYNKVSAYNLTNLLGIYLKLPAISADDKMQKLVELLENELRDWIVQRCVGRRYKGGFVKFEPKDLEKMPVSISAIEDLHIGFKPLTSSEQP